MANFECVVIGTPAELTWLMLRHRKLLNAKMKGPRKLVFENGVRVNYVTESEYKKWCTGRTYMHLVDYMMGNDVFLHSGNYITKEQFIKCIDGKE